jgi:hypothetical protein
MTRAKPTKKPDENSMARYDESVNAALKAVLDAAKAVKRAG